MIRTSQPKSAPDGPGTARLQAVQSGGTSLLRPLDRRSEGPRNPTPRHRARERQLHAQSGIYWVPRNENFWIPIDTRPMPLHRGHSSSWARSRFAPGDGLLKSIECHSTQCAVPERRRERDSVGRSEMGSSVSPPPSPAERTNTWILKPCDPPGDVGSGPISRTPPSRPPQSVRPW